MLPQPSATAVSLVETIRFLSRPESYPDGPESVFMLETHFSYVFLTDDQVYKLKKPQRYPFVDLSSLSARRANCHEEVRLNRRLAPGIYLGVATLRRTPDGQLALDEAGETVDYLVHMRRLDDRLNLERQLREGHPRESELDLAAERLVAFYLESAPTSGVDPTARRMLHEEHAAELDALLGNDKGSRLKGRLLAWLDGNSAVLARRRELEVHGDLRPEHIDLGPTPCMIDRLEFNPRFRRLDPLEELAFLALECDRLGQRWVGERFLRYYLDRTGDRPPDQLEPYYQAGRALLWALLGARHLATQPEHSERWRRKADWYIEKGFNLMTNLL